jgi:hypothetical protein
VESKELIVMSGLQDKPSKKDFADLINRITGEETVTERKLDQILKGAKKSYQNQGTEGFFDYLRQIVPVPVSDEWMEKTWNKMQTTEGAKKMFDQLNIPTDSLISPAETAPKKKKRKNN